MIKLRYLTANLAWAFTFGDALLRLYRTDLDVAPLFFADRNAAVREAERLGLKVDEDGVVSVEVQ
jgi:hypothetical protein